MLLECCRNINFWLLLNSTDPPGELVGVRVEALRLHRGESAHPGPHSPWPCGLCDGLTPSLFMHHFLLKHSKDVDLAIITRGARFTFTAIVLIPLNLFI